MNERRGFQQQLFRFPRPLFERAFKLVPKWSQTDLCMNHSKNSPSFGFERGQPPGVLTPIIPEHRTLRQKDHKFEASIDKTQSQNWKQLLQRLLSSKSAYFSCPVRWLTAPSKSRGRGSLTSVLLHSHAQTKKIVRNWKKHLAKIWPFRLVEFQVVAPNVQREYPSFFFSFFACFGKEQPLFLLISCWFGECFCKYYLWW